MQNVLFFDTGLELICGQIGFTIEENMSEWAINSLILIVGVWYE